jgi:hypothetical protein
MLSRLSNGFLHLMYIKHNTNTTVNEKLIVMLVVVESDRIVPLKTVAYLDMCLTMHMV